MDIKRVVQNYNRCQLIRSKLYPEPTESILTKIEGTFTHLGLDIIGFLIKAKNNNQKIIITVDYFTNWVEEEPTENIASKNIIKFLVSLLDIVYPK